jgi:DNA-binding CsgD family transcriptional regulator
MADRPVEDAAIAHIEEEIFAARLLARHAFHQGRQGTAPAEFIVCHLTSQGWSPEEIAADYGCAKASVLRRLRQARALYERHQ